EAAPVGVAAAHQAMAAINAALITIAFRTSSTSMIGRAGAVLARVARRADVAARPAVVRVGLEVGAARGAGAALARVARRADGAAAAAVVRVALDVDLATVAAVAVAVRVAVAAREVIDDVELGPVVVAHGRFAV